MNINRNNYERFFLLYADDELSDTEKKMVASFVQENADLEEEFIMLQQSIVKPDKDIKLEDKSFLLRQEQKFISQNNYEEIFILYNDGELNQNEEKQTEEFVTEHPELQNEFAVWQKVKFNAEHSIVFPNKSLLLKQEVKKKVIPLNFWKVLAAAVLLGFGLWAGVNFLQNEKVFQPIVNSTPGSSGTSEEPVTQPAVPNSNVVKAINNKIVPITKSAVKNIRVSPEKLPVAHDLVEKNMHQKEKNPGGLNTTFEQNKNEVEYKAAVENNIIVNHDTKKPVQSTTTELMPENKNITSKPSENYAFTASYIADEKNDNYVFYNVSEEQFKKSKLGGFLKKVKRVIERKSLEIRNKK